MLDVMYMYTKMHLSDFWLEVESETEEIMHMLFYECFNMLSPGTILE